MRVGGSKRSFIYLRLRAMPRPLMVAMALLLALVASQGTV